MRGLIKGEGAPEAGMDRGIHGMRIMEQGRREMDGCGGRGGGVGEI